VVGKPLEQQVNDELKPGEQLIWQGRPASKRGQQQKTEYLVMGLLIWGGFLTLGGAIALAQGDPGFIFCLVVAFVLAVVIAIRNRHSSPYRLARTVHALTNRRVFIVRDYPPRQRVETVPLQFIGDAAIVDRTADGRGTVRLGSRDPGSGRKQPEPLRLYMIEKPERTHDLILQARQTWIDKLHAAV
jgi:hypothetical protein